MEKKFNIFCQSFQKVKLGFLYMYIYIYYTLNAIFQAFILSNFDHYGLQIMKTPNSVSENLNIKSLTLQSLLKKLDVRSAVSKYNHRALGGRKRSGRKRCTSNRDNRSIERTVKQNPFKKDEAGVSISRATMHR